MVFPSEPWIRAVIGAVNQHPRLGDALRGLGSDLAAVVEADPPALRRPFAVYGKQAHGRIEEVRVLADPDDIWELEPSYVVRAPYRVWKALLRGDDPVKAALSGRVRVEGDLESLVRRAQYRYIVDEALGTIATRFVDEEG